MSAPRPSGLLPTHGRLVFIALIALSACSTPPVDTGTNPVDACAQDQDCPKGYHCAVGACQLLPRPCSTSADCDLSQSCQGEVCLPANRGYCDPCATTADCARGGLCVSFPSGGATICGAACQGSSQSCPSGAACEMTTDSSGADAGFNCLPPSGVCPATNGGSPDGGPATFSYINQNLFLGPGQNCTSYCHAANAAASFGSLDLVTDPYTALLGSSGAGAPATNVQGSATGLLRVSPGNPQASLLLIKLQLTAKSAQYGNKMPMTPPAAPQSMIDAVQSWIAAGAPNN